MACPSNGDAMSATAALSACLGDPARLLEVFLAGYWSQRTGANYAFILGGWFAWCAGHVHATTARSGLLASWNAGSATCSSVRMRPLDRWGGVGGVGVRPLTVRPDQVRFALGGILPGAPLAGRGPKAPAGPQGLLGLGGHLLGLGAPLRGGQRRRDIQDGQAPLGWHPDQQVLQEVARPQRAVLIRWLAGPTSKGTWSLGRQGRCERETALDPGVQSRVVQAGVGD